MNILIVGATGNLGSCLAKHLHATQPRLRLLVHNRALPFELPAGSNVEIVHGDLDAPDSLARACANIDCIVYVAGLLFRPWPERFLQRTNTVYVQNIVGAALSAGVRKFILVSFPHVEEGTTPQAPGAALWMSIPNRFTRVLGSKPKNACFGHAKVATWCRSSSEPESSTDEI